MAGVIGGMKDDRLWDWKWGQRPKTVAEFDVMMASLDAHLAHLELSPAQRPLNAALLVSNRLGLSGTPLFGSPLPRGPAFSASDLLARVHEWYEANYGDQIKLNFSPGSIVVAMHGNLWQLEMPRAWGSFQVFLSTDLKNSGRNMGTSSKDPATMNLLLSVKGLTQSHASRMTAADLHTWAEAFQLGYGAVEFLDSLEGHHLYTEARGDYRHSVSALLSGRELGKARWESSQCAEKVMKGLLAQAGNSYPTGGKNGHSIVHLGVLLRSNMGIDLDPGDLDLIECSPAVRYGEEATTRDRALAAHYALLRMLASLSAASSQVTKNE